MKILIIVNSSHRQNTRQIAEAMAEVAPAVIADIENIGEYNTDDYDLIGFCSGIYAGKFGSDIVKFAKNMSDKQQDAFVFSTSGTGKPEKYNADFVKVIESKNKRVLGSSGCKGLCKWFIFALVGGIAKGHPDMDDFEAAQQFITEVMQKHENT